MNFLNPETNRQSRNEYYVPASELAAIPQYENSWFIDQWNRKCVFVYSPYGTPNVVCTPPLPPVRLKGITNTLCAIENKLTAQNDS